MNNCGVKVYCMKVDPACLFSFPLASFRSEAKKHRLEQEVIFVQAASAQDNLSRSSLLRMTMLWPAMYDCEYDQQLLFKVLLQ